MSSKAKGSGPREPQGPTGTIREIVQTRRGVEVILRLRNDDARAIHYIASIRTVRYDPATKRVVIGLSDEGRAVIPGAADVHPTFRHIDPGSEAELQLVLPPKIVKLAPAGPPGSEVRFEEQDPSEAEEVVVEIAWSDTPFYDDPREARREAPPTEQWAKGKTVIAAKGLGKPGRTEPPAKNKK